MYNKFKYNKKTREDVWSLLCDCETKIINLKGIVQNEMELQECDWYRWVSDKNKLFETLDSVQQKLKTGYDYI